MHATEVCHTISEHLGFNHHSGTLPDTSYRFPKLLQDSGCTEFYNASNVTYNDRGKHCKLEGQRG